jgi:hypothetical protein
MWKYRGEQSGILSMSHLWCNASPTPFEGKVLKVYRAAFIVAFLLHHWQGRKCTIPHLVQHLPYSTLRYWRCILLLVVQCFIYTICRSWRCTPACKSTQFTGTEMHWSACSASLHLPSQVLKMHCSPCGAAPFLHHLQVQKMCLCCSTSPTPFAGT